MPRGGILHSEAVRKPQEIDGKGSENLPLCRNRDARFKRAQSEDRPSASLNRSAMHRAQTTQNQ